MNTSLPPQGGPPTRPRLREQWLAIWLSPFASCRLSRGFLALLCPFLLLLFSGATYVVPDYTPTIQAAIDSAASGDTVLVRDGTYVENLHVLDKALTLKALGAPEATIIDGNQQGSVIEVTGDAYIEGFTIQNGLNDAGGGIRSR